MKGPSTNISPKVLMYHRIVKNHSQKNANPFSIGENEFRQQLRMLERFNFTPITFEDYYLYLRNELTLPKKPIILTFDDGLEGVYEIAFPVLCEFNMRAVVFVMGDRTLRKARWYKGTEGEDCPLITDQQIVELRSEGFEIGSHGMTHTPLSGLKRKEQEAEILESKNSIERLLGEQIYTFSYPYGLHNRSAQSIVKQAGYHFACGVYTGPPQFGSERFDIRRLAIKYDIKTVSFLLRVLTPYQYAEWLYGKVRLNGHKQGAERVVFRKTETAEYDFSSTENF